MKKFILSLLVLCMFSLGSLSLSAQGDPGSGQSPQHPEERECDVEWKWTLQWNGIIWVPVQVPILSNCP